MTLYLQSLAATDRPIGSEAQHSVELRDAQLQAIALALRLCLDLALQQAGEEGEVACQFGNHEVLMAELQPGLAQTI
jgi:hypothetical protein